MKQTDLDLLIRCQKKIKEAMGEWEDGDRCYHPYSHLQNGIYINEHFVFSFMKINKEQFLRRRGILYVPPAFPTLGERPERSLWGMITSWKKIEDYNLQKITVETNKGTFIANNFYTAMLLALCKQWGVRLTGRKGGEDGTGQR